MSDNSTDDRDEAGCAALAPGTELAQTVAAVLRTFPSATFIGVQPRTPNPQSQQDKPDVGDNPTRLQRSESIMSDFTGKGYLARNGRKEPGSQQPDLRGKLNIGGTEFELAGWEKEKDGRQYVSLTVQPARDSNRPATRSTPAGRGDTAERNSARLLESWGREND
jgi:hypothetical protein